MTDLSDDDDRDTRWKCKILQIKMPFDQNTFGFPFNLLVFQDDITVDSTRDVAICVSTDESSNIQTVFNISEFQPDYKISTVVVNPEQEILAGDLLINIFLLPLCRPVTDLFPLRRKTADENRPRRVATLASATLVNDAAADVTTLTISAEGIKWNKSIDSISGRFRIFSTLVSKVPGVYGDDGRLRFRFARLIWSSDSYGVLSKLVLNHDVLNLYLGREESRTNNWLQTTPPTGLSLRLQLLTDREKLDGPYFSGTGPPYFGDKHCKCLEITAPYDFTVSRDHVHRLRIYRKYYGSYVGIFAPKFDIRLKITPEIWHPRNWLDITISSQGDEDTTIIYGETLGHVYFSDTEYNAYPYGEEDEYADEVRSRIVIGDEEDSENVSVIGLTIIHDRVPDLRVKTNGRRESTSHTLMRVLA